MSFETQLVSLNRSEIILARQRCHSASDKNHFLLNEIVMVSRLAKGRRTLRFSVCAVWVRISQPSLSIFAMWLSIFCRFSSPCFVVGSEHTFLIGEGLHFHCRPPMPAPSSHHSNFLTFPRIDISPFLRLSYHNRRSQNDGAAVIGYGQAFQPRTCLPSHHQRRNPPTVRSPWLRARRSDFSTQL